MKPVSLIRGWARPLAGAFSLFVIAGLAVAEPLKVRVGYPTALHGEIAKVLEKTDILAKHELTGEFTFFQYGPPQVEALVAESIDVSFTSLVPTATLLSKQPGYVSVVAGLGNSIHGLLVPADSPIHSLADFKGRSIAVAVGTDSYIDLLVALKAAGLDPKKDVTLQNVPPNEQAAAFEQKLVDGVLTRPPQLEKLQAKNGAREIQQWPHHLWVIARNDYLKEHPEFAAKFQAALRDAVRYIMAHPSQSAAWFGEQLRQDPANVQKVAGLNPLFASPADQVSVEPTATLRTFAANRADELVEFGVTKQPVVFFGE